jgi:hypothetical protein
MTGRANNDTVSLNNRLSQTLRDFALALALAMAALWKETRADWGGYSVGTRALHAGLAIVGALVGMWLYDHVFRKKTTSGAG